MRMNGNIADVSMRRSPTKIKIETNADIVPARHAGRVLAEKAGLSPGDHTLIATAIHELARNIVQYAHHGEISMEIIEKDSRIGVAVVASDNGPGIADPEKAARGGYSTSNGLGLGLAGVRHIMDEFHMHSAPGLGTRIAVTKWRL